MSMEFGILFKRWGGFNPLVSVVCLGVLLPEMAFAALQVFPTRLTLTDKDRTKHLTLRHMGDKPEVYKIETTFFKMTPTGALEKDPKPGPNERVASKYIHFSPREVTLEPNREQIFRVMAIIPKNIPDGDYRAHLTFTPIDISQDQSIEALIKGDKSKMEPKKISASVKTVVSLSIPVIVRHGEVKNEVKLSNLQFNDVAGGPAAASGPKVPFVKVDLDSLGNGFPWGIMYIRYTPRGASEAVLVGEHRGVSAYNPHQTLSLELNSIPKGTQILKGGILEVTYQEPEEEGGKVYSRTQVKVE